MIVEVTFEDADDASKLVEIIQAWEVGGLGLHDNTFFSDGTPNFEHTESPVDGFSCKVRSEE
tara:strand:+ start:399 stop:584 length:186 start_codon:yes stop_codon:yes gene_type:complete